MVYQPYCKRYLKALQELLKEEAQGYSNTQELTSDLIQGYKCGTYTYIHSPYEFDGRKQVVFNVSNFPNRCDKKGKKKIQIVPRSDRAVKENPSACKKNHSGVAEKLLHGMANVPPMVLSPDSVSSVPCVFQLVTGSCESGESTCPYFHLDLEAEQNTTEQTMD